MILRIIIVASISFLVFLLGYNIGILNKPHERPPCPEPKTPGVKVTLKPIATPEKLPSKPMRSTLFHNDGNFAITDIFSGIHHPTSVNKNELYFVNDLYTWPADHKKAVNASCREVFLTRTGSRANQPNKCTALVKVEHGRESAQQISNRWGFTAKLTNQNQNDFSRKYSRDEEIILLPPLMRDLPKLKEEFLNKMGQPVDVTTGKRRTAIIMVANEGVMDLLLNFICSAQRAGINVKDIMVFVDGPDNAKLVQSMGAQAMFADSLGSMPARAAGNYLDKTFSRMMWFKMSSVYLAQTAGFNLLFQDTDLVWLKDPVPYLESIDEDVAFMDDGARTPRYTPFFTNSGFYYMKWNRKTLYFHEKMLKHAASEIGYTHSHQSVLIRHLVESHHLVGLQVLVLDQKMFPSGAMYHHNKGYMKTVRDHSFVPHVFHMCWTANRKDKVIYFKELGYWHLPDNNRQCTFGPQMAAWAKKSDAPITSSCCITPISQPLPASTILQMKNKK